MEINRIAAKTHEGAHAAPMSPEQALRRSVMSCLLWEREFYENGTAIADRIEQLCQQVSPKVIAALAIEARHKMHLRHVPLLLLASLAKLAPGTSLVSDTIETTIARADEITELLAIYWRRGKCPLSAQLKRGLARAFRKFSTYQLAKYNRAKAIRLRDVMFLVHAKPESESQVNAFRDLANKTLSAPDTWEVALSAGADKRETFTRLLTTGDLGYLALLRNLRNMAESEVNPDLICEAILAGKGAHQVLPFRYVAAVRAAPQFANELDHAMQKAIERLPLLSGTTLVLADVSGSMDDPLSARSDLSRLDAAAALASLINGSRLRVFTFSEKVVECAPWRGLAGISEITNSQNHSGTYLGQALRTVCAATNNCWDRLIIITDEQSHDRVEHPGHGRCYMINVASAKHGVGYGEWTHIDGFSENVIRYIAELEAQTHLAVFPL